MYIGMIWYYLITSIELLLPNIIGSIEKACNPAAVGYKAKAPEL